MCRCEFSQRSKGNKNSKYKTMTTEIIKNEMPPILPHGWKTEVAKLLGIHVNTVTNALRDGSGDTYDRIMKTAKEKYGKPVNQTQHENN